MIDFDDVEVCELCQQNYPCDEGSPVEEVCNGCFDKMQEERND